MNDYAVKIEIQIQAVDLRDAYAEAQAVADDLAELGASLVDVQQTGVREES